MFPTRLNRMATFAHYKSDRSDSYTNIVEKIALDGPMPLSKSENEFKRGGSCRTDTESTLCIHT